MAARQVKLSMAALIAHGCVLCALGGLQIAGTLQFNSVFGAAVGAMGLTAGILLVLTAASAHVEANDTPAPRRPPNAPAPPVAVLPRWLLRGVRGLSVALLLLVLVHAVSPDPVAQQFPAACPPTKLLGCSRVAAANSHRDGGRAPLRLPTPLPNATEAVLRWIRSRPRAEVLLVQHAPPAAPADGAAAPAASAFIHARFVSLLWGFADDVFVRLTCVPAGADADSSGETQAALLEVQGQLRLGVGDLEVNVARNVALLSHMEAEMQQGHLPRGGCGGSS